MKPVKVTAIVCAYNEETTIARVLTTLVESPAIHEIVVVNDGSLDKTGAYIDKHSHSPKVQVITFDTNRGKGYAMAEGVIAAHNDILMFVDADLLNFRGHFIDLLLDPLKRGLADMVIGHPTENMADEKLNPFKPLSGERTVYRADVLPLVEEMRKSRFGVETLINLSYQSRRKRIHYVPLWGLVHPIKFQKYSLARATREYSAATNQIVKTAVVNYTLLLGSLQGFFRGEKER
ncbi:MAG TPA: glycosyltransferase family 2 protein [Bacteroidota bacterium]|nr:glycosyltransferase family 2 protein [Bacteroidota bacterium]